MARITITAPSSAEEGERVSASVRVWNNTEYYASFKGDIEALPALYPGYVIGSIDNVIGPGSSVTRSVSFTMPDCDVTVFIWLERWGEFDDDWTYDSAKSKVVKLEVPEPTTFHLSVSVPSGGSVSPGSGDYPAYSTVTLRATPFSGYQFVRWGGDASGTSRTYNLYMNGNKSVTAYFEKVPVILPCEITIDAPSSAEEGETVNVAAIIKNVSNISIVYKIELYGVPDLFPDFRIGTIEKNINSGETFTAYGSFTMPASNTTVFIWVERWAVDHWVYDNSASKVISLVPEYKGIISKKELEYDGARSIIPVY